jgi:hypothetical protein
MTQNTAEPSTSIPARLTPYRVLRWTLDGLMIGLSMAVIALFAADVAYHLGFLPGVGR